MWGQLHTLQKAAATAHDASGTVLMQQLLVRAEGSRQCRRAQSSWMKLQRHHPAVDVCVAGEVVDEAAAVALLKEFCTGHGITSPPPSAFLHLFRKYDPSLMSMKRLTPSLSSHVSRCLLV